MLRSLVLGLGLLLLFGSALSALWGDLGSTLWLLAAGFLLTVGTAFERVLYKPVLTDRPGQGWISTGERFVDPETNQTVEIFYNRASGERRYVAAAGR